MTSSRALVVSVWTKATRAGHPALGRQVGHLSGPCVFGVAGQAGHAPGGQSRKVETADPQGADLAKVSSGGLNKALVPENLLTPELQDHLTPDAAIPEDDDR